MGVRDEVESVSGDPDAGFAWARQAELPEATEKCFMDSAMFASLDAKLAAGIAKAVQESNAKDKFVIQ